MGIEKIPKAVIRFAIVLQDIVEFFFCLSLDGVPFLEALIQLSLVEGSQNMLAIREQKSVADIEENGFQWSGHISSSHAVSKKGYSKVNAAARTSLLARNVRSSQTRFNKACTRNWGARNS